MKLNCIFPENFFSEEERDGYVVSAQMKKVWAVELDLLNELSQVCKKYSIPYWLSSGSLLGAVRHEGIIPWDDDIDVMMFRKDYNRLCEIGVNEFRHPYFFQTEQTDPGSLRGHIQLRNSETTGILKGELKTGRTFNQGIFLDIFPLDNVPNNPIERQKFLQYAQQLMYKSKRRANLSIYYKFRWRKNVPVMCFHLLVYLLYKLWPSCSYFNYEKAYQEFERFVTSYNDTETDEMITSPFYSNGETLKCSWFKDGVKLPFEFMSMPAPCGFVKYLKTLYGDYQKFVVGTSMHGGIFFDTEKSYKEYL